MIHESCCELELNDVELNDVELNNIYVPLGIDCCIAHQLNQLKLRHFSLPFDWSYTKNLSSIIEILNDNFSSFLDISMYEIKEIESNSFPYLVMDSSIVSKYKLKHKKYNIILPHELKSLDSYDIELFQNRYNRRIQRFIKLNDQNKKIIFIRLGITKELKLLDKLNESLSKYFINYEIKFIDLSKLGKTTDWKRDEINWSKYLF